MKRGLFITLEGIDGTGKTTQFRMLADYLQQRGYAVRATREPGGTHVGEQIRRILLSGSARRDRNRRGAARRAPTPLSELVLMYAARAQHLDEVVRPALARGQLLLSDRFNDASMAYQGYGRELGLRMVRSLDRIICGRTQPDLTIVLDLSPRVALRRALRRAAKQKSRDSRFETEGLKFQERARVGYLALARQQPQRIKIVRADRPVAEVQADIRNLVNRLLEERSKPLGPKEQIKRQKSKSKRQKQRTTDY